MTKTETKAKYFTTLRQVGTAVCVKQAPVYADADAVGGDSLGDARCATLVVDTPLQMYRSDTLCVSET